MRGGTTEEEKEEKAGNASLKTNRGKNPHSDESCDDVKKKHQQEESCYRDTMTKSHKSNVHRRPTSDVHKRPTFDVHRRPPNLPRWPRYRHERQRILTHANEHEEGGNQPGLAPRPISLAPETKSKQPDIATVDSPD